MNIVAEGASVPLLLISGVFMVWRCWVIWYSVNPYIAYAVVFFPSLMLLGSTIGSVFYFFALIHPTSIVAGVPVGVHTSAWAVRNYTLILGMNVIVTVLILIRLIAHRPAVRKSLPSAQMREYTSLIAMMIESSAPHSIIGAACLITTNVGNPVGTLFSSASIPTQQLSGYLIIAQLAYGHGWKTTTVSVHSKIAMRRHVPTSDTQMSDEESGTVSIN